MDDSYANLAAFVAELDAEFGPPDEADVQRFRQALRAAEGVGSSE